MRPAFFLLPRQDSPRPEDSRSIAEKICCRKSPEGNTPDQAYRGHRSHGPHIAESLWPSLRPMLSRPLRVPALKPIPRRLLALFDKGSSGAGPLIWRCYIFIVTVFTSV